MIKYKSGYKYQLVEDYTIQTKIIPSKNIKTDYLELSKDGLLVIKKGYCWDGASGYPDLKTIIRGSLIHDSFFQLLRFNLIEKRYKKEADNLLYKCCLKDGMYKWNAKLVLWGVQKFGKRSTLAKNKKKIHTAP